MEYAARYVLSITDVSIGVFVLMLVFLIVSSFFSMSETVFSSVNVIRLKRFIEDGKKGSKKALWITEHFDLTLSTILVGNNLANIALATISVGVFANIFNGNETLINIMNTFVMTTIILIFGEIVPKSFAKKQPEKIALIISSLMYWIIKILQPITYIFIQIKSWIIRGDKGLYVTVTEEELETIIDTMEEEGSIDEDSAEMLQSVLDLNDRKVYEIMTPRVDMVGININDGIEEIKRVFFQYQFSRLPVFEETRDNVIGIIHERDFLTCLLTDDNFDIRNVMKEPMFVAKSMRIDTLIETLQRENSHLAVVSGEYGGTSGIVTMEDALEELVGEIYDEYDVVDDEMIKQLKDNKFGIHAEMDLEDLFEELDIGPHPLSHYASIGAWLYNQFEEIPEVDESYSYIQEIPNLDHDDEEPTRLLLKFVIKDLKERRISYVHLIIEEIDNE